jgi:DNA ligase-1
LKDVKHTKVLDNVLIENNGQLDDMFNKIISEGGEGVILRNKDSVYKFGRSTIKEQGLLKIKPFETFDAKIIGITERFENTGESFKNELGNSVKHNFKDNKISTGMAACFIVEYKEQEVKPVITGSEAFRKEIWENKESYIGKMIEYKGMLVGAKEVPRHPVFLRFREDRD